mmetsp:Transcript_8949/g.13564  ORF Transcript_8949/g.13564 Transcript_8949/m.13564 type:complete len:313 (-) Transcript_8949:2-940(-)
MALSSLLRGVFAPLPTPFSSTGAFDSAKFVENFPKVFTKENDKPFFDGACVLGSTGEFALLTEQEKVGVMEAGKKAADKYHPTAKLLTGTGCPSTEMTIERCKIAADLGYDAVMVVTPYYYNAKMTEDVMFDHFTTVASSSPVPVVLYSMPAFAALEISPHLAHRLAPHPNIIGMKDSGGAYVKEYVQETEGEDFGVLVGSAGGFVDGLEKGAVGGIMGLTNVAGDYLRDTYQLCQEGNWEKGREINEKLKRLNALVVAKLGPAGVKYALEVRGGFGGEVRRPLVGLESDEKREVERVLKEVLEECQEVGGY